MGNLSHSSASITVIHEVDPALYLMSFYNDDSLLVLLRLNRVYNHI